MKHNEAHPQNINGKLYCTDQSFDSGCIACGQCYGQLPEVFHEDEDTFAFVHKNPTGDELIIVKELIEDCPTDSIVLIG
jgi:ferredoxin